MVSVAELREKLVELGLSTEEAASIVGKKNIMNKIEELQVKEESEDLFDNAELQDDEICVEENSDSKENFNNESQEPPEMTDPKWSDYALSHLEESELIKGHPKADSLRRITELLLGPVINIHTEVPQTPNIDNERRATVVVHIEVYIDGEFNLKASGVADVFPGNTDHTYAKFATATAETRAEGRAYRKLLRLINVVTAEELVDEDEIFDPTDRISETQITMIEQLCSTAKLNIDIKSLLELNGVKVEDLHKVPKAKGQKICMQVSSYQETGVPEDIIGYKPDWRN